MAEGQEERRDCHHDHHGHDHHHHHDHHEHSHAGPGIETLLEYMVEHNRSHAGELAELAGKLRREERQGMADLLSAGVKDFERGNEKLAQALELLRGGPG
jgi:ABC-type Zn2+ transport system substrate-binding protein/surface adhesin